MKFSLEKIRPRSGRDSEDIAAVWEYLDKLRARLLRYTDDVCGDKSIPIDRLAAGTLELGGGRLVISDEGLRLETGDGTQYIELAGGRLTVAADTAAE